ncbi:MAG: hypothetical protein WA931_08920 [Rhodococcus sp. (in: high G+C Gram-positive bacteria)]
MTENVEVRNSRRKTNSLWIDGKADIDLGALRSLVAAAEGLPDSASVTVDKRWGANADRSSCWFKRIEVSFSEKMPSEQGVSRDDRDAGGAVPDR